uniref:Integrase, catalytic region, zinc finger, CCHC-type, peptidase aspartic, catalytic n=1 Tax=Tanacetum cinerariifolium TaxID=118510 RepID=A0A6L2NVP8_TANCI|nr:integrase, catalytic region, zinc finger, CCHC-type, peptidase aspartic, catalytic [Tanacetum cinerariifolium]
MLKIDMEPIAPRLLNNRTAHSDYLRLTQEQPAILREVVKQGKSQNPLNNSLDHACSTKKDKIQQPPSSTQKNKVEAHHRTVKSSLKIKNYGVKPKGTVIVQYSKLNVNSKLICVMCNGCMLYDNHDLCALNVINDVNARPKSKSIKKTSKRKVWKLTAKVVQIVLWYLDFGCSKHMTGDRSQLTNFVSKFLGTVKFRNDHVAKIMGYSDYQIGNVTISRVYYMEGLGHNLFSVGQFCYLNLEVAFRQHTGFIRNLEGEDLFTGSRGNNLYTLSIRDMMASSSICLLSKASKTMSWLWHRRLSHLNFGTINHLARHGLVRVAPEPAALTGSPSSTTVDQDAPSASNSQTLPKTKSLVISIDVEEDNHDLDVAHMNNGLFFGIPILENASEASSSSDVIPTFMHTVTPLKMCRSKTMSGGVTS